MNYCCLEMKTNAEFKCTVHKTEFDCPDSLISYRARFDEYIIIIHDGGSSGILIGYCPWCGKKLPISKRG